MKPPSRTPHLPGIKGIKFGPWEAWSQPVERGVWPSGHTVGPRQCPRWPVSEARPWPTLPLLLVPTSGGTATLGPSWVSCEVPLLGPAVILHGTGGFMGPRGAQG